MKIQKIGILMLAMGCMAALSGCTPSYIEETEDELDPLGYAATGYYGKTQEELKELLPKAEYGSAESMVQESAITETISCKQVFYFYENKMVEIQYIYLFERGEEAEEKFIEQCQRIAEIDGDAYATEFGKAMPISEISEGFWDEMLQEQYLHYYNNTVRYMIYCDEESTRGVNEAAVPGGWKKQFRIEISGVFNHKEIDMETNEIRESGKTLPDGNEARITLRIATWE